METVIPWGKGCPILSRVLSVQVKSTGIGGRTVFLLQEDEIGQQIMGQGGQSRPSCLHTYPDTKVLPGKSYLDTAVMSLPGCSCLSWSWKRSEAATRLPTCGYR